ncbi:MAG: radical SAM protein [Thaumarchaeota archaeon]|nr:radical SAM protein [Candidatus Terraquivivens yellowstonensis]
MSAPVRRLFTTPIWQNREVRERLKWYYGVMSDLKPAKFLIAKRIPCEINIEHSSDERLWEEHERLSKTFNEILNEIKNDRMLFDELKPVTVSYIDLKVEIAKRILKSCHFCEWKCKVNRYESKKLGACRVDSKSRVSTWFHHFGEEPPLVGYGGSGTIFFAGCTFKCVFCQNWDISQDPFNGVEVDGKKLALIMRELRNTGALNINFVGGEPTPNLHTILEGMKHLGTNVPMLWNSNMYMSLESMALLVDVIDIWLPDFKYGNDNCAIRLSKIPRYFEVVSRNHKIAHDYGDMIIRHLVLPNHLNCCTKPVLKWISENCPRALVNIMEQYRPEYIVAERYEEYPDIARRPTHQEMEEAYAFADSLNIVYKPVS